MGPKIVVFPKGRAAAAWVKQQNISIVDVRKLDPDERWELAQGEEIAVSLGTVSLEETEEKTKKNADIPPTVRTNFKASMISAKHLYKISKTALAAFSPVFKHILEKGVDATELQFPPSEITEDALHAVFKFMLSNIRYAQPVALDSGDEFLKSLHIYHLGRILGWSKRDYLREIYIDITRDIVHRGHIMGYDELDELMALPDDDPVWRVTVVVFANFLVKELIGDKKNFKTWLKSYPDFEKSLKKKQVKQRLEREQKKQQLKAKRRKPLSQREKELEEILEGLDSDYRVSDPEVGAP